MRILPSASAVALSSLALAAGCGLIAGVKDRTLAEGSGGSTGTSTSSTSSTATSSTGAGGQGGTSTATNTTATVTTGVGAGGSGGNTPCPLPGGTGVETVVCNQAHPSNLRIEGSSLFWINEGDGSIVTTPTTSSTNAPPKVIIAGQAEICGLSIANGYAYWGTKQGLVRRISLDAESQFETIADNQGASCAISASNDRVFWAHAGPLNNVIISSVTLAEPQVLVPEVITDAVEVKTLDASASTDLFWTGPSHHEVYHYKVVGKLLSQYPTGGAPFGVFTDGTRVAWTNRSLGLLTVTNLDFSNPVMVPEQTTQPTALVLRDTHLYWVEELSNGRVLGYQIGAASSLDILAEGQNSPCSIALDAAGKFVFWTNCLGGEVRRRSVSAQP